MSNSDIKPDVYDDSVFVSNRTIVHRCGIVSVHAASLSTRDSSIKFPKRFLPKPKG